MLDVNKHVDSDHRDDEECLKCTTYENEENVLKDELAEKDKVIQSINVVRDNVISKNVSLNRENKRLKLALKQSEFEKQTIKKELEANRESLSTALRENTVLNETVKLHESIKETLS